jgi:sulfur-oxidizing protein SoxZ
VQAPNAVAKDEIFQIRTLINHPMETGLHHDDVGHVIPRDIINKFMCRYI